MFFLAMLTDPADLEFFDALVREHSGRMFTVAYELLESRGRPNREDAFDIVQDTFIKIYKNIARFYGLGREEIIPLIVIYTKNTAKDFLRRRSNRLHLPLFYENDDEEEAELPLTDDAPLPEEIVIRRETVDRTAAAIDALPETQRHAVLLKYRYGYTDREIAKILCISETAVSSRLNRAREALRKLLKGEDL